MTSNQLNDAYINRLEKLSPEKRAILLQKLQNKEKVRAKSLSIPKRENANLYPMSFAQEGFWFLDQLSSEKYLNNIPAVLKIEGRLNRPALEKSLNAILKRQQILRAKFVVEAGAPVQKMEQELLLKLPVLDFKINEKNEKKEKIRQIIRDEVLTPFELSKGPLIRTKLLKLGDYESYLIFTLHHIIADAWSIGVLIDEMTRFYSAFVNDKPTDLPDLPIQYFDYAYHQRQLFVEKKVDNQIQYWKNRLSNLPSPLVLATDRSYSSVHSFKGSHFSFHLSKTLTDELNNLSKKQGATLFMTLLAAFHVLLYRLSGQNDICVGVPLANRDRPEIEKLIGLFINTVVMRSNIQGGFSFAQILAQVKAMVLEAYTNKDVPFEKLVQLIQPNRKLGTNPLFQVLFDFRTGYNQSINIPDLSVEMLKVETETVKFDLVLSLEETPEGIEGVFGFKTDLFTGDTIERFSKYYRTLLEKIVLDTTQSVSRIPILSDREINVQIEKWNATKAVFHPENNRCIHDYFAKTAHSSPDQTALVQASGRSNSFPAYTLSFADLNRRANQLAHYLLKKGAGPDKKIGLCLPRSLDMIIGILGILKSGGAYVPIDPNLPESRIDFMVRDSGLNILLTHGSLQKLFKQNNHLTILLDSLWDIISAESDADISGYVTPFNLAYLIYTSGSTGTPKAVMIEHRTLVNHCFTMMEKFRLKPDDKVLQFISLSFDASAEEIFPALLGGASLILPDAAFKYSANDLFEICAQQGITILHLPVPVLHNLIDYLQERGQKLPEKIRIIAAGGEKISPQKLKIVKKLIHHPIQFMHVYGPTEATITSTSFTLEISSDQTFDYETIPIGRPVNQTRIYLTDENLELLPIGRMGEILIGGAGLSRGYLNNPALTAEKFIPDMYSRKPGNRLYRTGDVARYSSDGNIEFIGRIDHQVKIRGFRVEPGEIEAVLNRHPAVDQVLVVAHKNRTGDHDLFAYLVKNPKYNLEQSDLRLYLEQRLPDYFVPASFIFLPEIPLTSSGKIDRKSLPLPGQNRDSIATVYQPPGTSLEKVLYEMWRDILGRDKIGIHDNFFELGGNSVQGATLLNRLQDRLGEYVYIVAIYDAPTISRLAAYIETNYPDSVAKLTGETSPTGGKKEKSEIRKINQDDVDRLQSIVRVPQSPLLNSPKKAGKNSAAVFILSAPRSGSTLLRVMLGGHPKLFAPPELQLLNFSTLQERKTVLSGRDSFWLDGTIRAMMELKKCNEEEARSMMTELEKEGIAIKTFYGLLQDWLGDRLFVDKTPNYALSEEILNLAETYFADALYLHLVRHPYGVIPSFEKAKLHVFYPPFFSEKHTFKVRELAELVWVISHQNIGKFLAAIPGQRKYRVRYEDLVTRPEAELHAICDFLNLEFHPDMLRPQKDRKKKMTDSLSPLGKMLGDVRFHEHKGISSTRAYRWQDEIKEDYLGEVTWELVESFEYPKRSVQKRNYLLKIKPIEKTSQGQKLFLSYSQQRLWFLDQLNPDSALYNMPLAVRVSGKINPVWLQDAVREIIKRHEVLRSYFVTIDGQPRLKISDNFRFSLSLFDLTSLPVASQQSESKRIVSQEAQRSFDLSRFPLLRAFLIRLSENESVLLFVMHHIVCDGMSLEIFFRELMTIYEGLKNKEPIHLPELPLQYSDFAFWQRKWLQNGKFQGQLEYWQEKLQDLPPMLKLPTDYPRPAVVKNYGAKILFTIEPEIFEKLNDISRESSSTLFMTLLAAFQVLLYRYTNQNKFAVGMPISGRNRKELEKLIGFFVNTLVIRANLSGKLSFLQLLENVKKTAIEAYANQDMPFEKVVDAVQPERDMSHTPLFQVLFVHQKLAANDFDQHDLKIEPLFVETGTAKFDLTFEIIEKQNELDGIVEYRTDLFQKDTIERFILHFKQIVKSFIKNPHQKISSINILSESERKQIETGWSPIDKNLSSNQCAHKLFEVQVEKNPKADAVYFEGTTLSYAELNRRANQVARKIREMNIGPEEVIGICLNRSPEIIIAILAVLKAGGAYLPIDPAYPEDRISFMLREAEISVLLSDQQLAGRMEHYGGQFIFLDELDQIDHLDITNLENSTLPQNLAYVIYTSGSTGRPKGVMLTHRGLCNLGTSYIRKIGLKSGHRVLQFFSFGFDGSVADIFMSLFAGATLYILPKEKLLPGPIFEQYIRENQITHMVLTPTILSLLSGKNLPDLEVVSCGGENFKRDLVRRWGEKKKFFNVYGPTECTVASSVARIDHVVEKFSCVPIGFPLPNVRHYILDQYLNPVPIGVQGELFIGGIGVARGYLRRADLTAEKFVPDPFGKKGDRLYKSGDLARYLSNGMVEILGRIDHQVKIRGFRIEPGEIEQILRQHPLIKDALIVTDEDDSDGKRLIGFLTYRNGQSPPTIGEIREFARQKLPEFMLPSSIMFLDSFPLNESGKIDRSALPNPEIDRKDLSHNYCAPRSEKEKVLVSIWQEILRIDRVGISDNFFELGGDSILSIQVVSRANRSGIFFTPAQLFQYPTIEGLLTVAETVPQKPKEQGVLLGDVPLLPVQHWFFENHQEYPHHWNQSILLDVHEKIDLSVFKKVIDVLLQRHDALRMRYRKTAKNWQQFYTGLQQDIPFSLIDLSEIALKELSTQIEKVSAETQASLSLIEGPVIRFVYFNLGKGRKDRLLIVAHHLIMDNVSWQILTEDMQTVYSRFKKGEQVIQLVKTTSYKHWASRLIEFAKTDEILAETEYWLNPDRKKATSIPVDFPSGRNTYKSVSMVSSSLAKEDTGNLLRRVPNEYSIQVQEVLVVALLQVLSRWTGEHHFQIDFESHGRENLFSDVDLSGTIGWFTSLYPVYFDLGKDNQLKNKIRRIKEVLRDVPHHGIGYGLLKYLQNDRNISRGIKSFPKSKISFNYLGQFNLGSFQYGNFKLAREGKGSEYSPDGIRDYIFEISINIFEGSLKLNWKYSKNLHREETIKYLIDEYFLKLKSIISFCLSSSDYSYTSSDFQEANLDQDELENIISELNED